MEVRTNHYVDRYLNMHNLSTDCWNDEGELVAVCAVDHKDHTAIAHTTKCYDGELELYFKRLEKFGYKILDVKIVDRSEIFGIRTQTFASGEPLAYEEG